MSYDTFVEMFTFEVFTPLLKDKNIPVTDVCCVTAYVLDFVKANY